MDLDKLLDFATHAAVRAGEITLEHFGSVTVEFKGDGSEVTRADRASEEYLRESIQEAFPQDGILGEEGTQVPSRSGRRWILDPIDGTRSFASGVPLYGVLLAMEESGSPVLGCIHFPALGQTLAAVEGGGAWLDGRRVRVSECDALREARVVTSGLEYWRDSSTEAGQRGWDALVRGCRFVRTWGDCYGFSLVATGRAEVMAEASVGALWDYSPMVPILREAGGRLTTLAGEPLSAWSSALATNGRVHEAALRCWEPGGAGDWAFQTEAVHARRRAPAGE